MFELMGIETSICLINKQNSYFKAYKVTNLGVLYGADRLEASLTEVDFTNWSRDTHGREKPLSCTMYPINPKYQKYTFFCTCTLITTENSLRTRSVVQ